MLKSQTFTDVGFIVRLRLGSADQPPVEVVRDQSENTKVYWTHGPQLVVHKGVVNRVTFDHEGQPNRRQLLVPLALREEIMSCIHQGLTGSHKGLARSTYQVARRAWWPGWRAAFVDSTDVVHVIDIFVAPYHVVVNCSLPMSVTSMRGLP